MQKKRWYKAFRGQHYLLLMSVPFIVWLIVFRYLPLAGWSVAFQNFRPHLGFFEQTWVGLRNFQMLFFESPDFFRVLQNTLALGFLGLVFGTFFALGFAILLNELRFPRFKRFTQTVSYLPHFISWVVAANIITQMLSLGGPINEFLIRLRIIEEPIHFMARQELFWWIVTFSDVWKSMGWSAIIYLAAMAGVDRQVYEAAEIDGVNRAQRIWHVTLPGISTTIFILLIINIGNLINIGFERPFMLSNAVTAQRALVLDFYALQSGIDAGRFSYGTAIGIFRSVVSIILLFTANFIARKAGGARLF